MYFINRTLSLRGLVAGERIFGAGSCVAQDYGMPLTYPNVGNGMKAGGG